MADKKKNENFFVRAGKGIAQYAKATKSELKKVSWPTRKQLVNNTAIVIVCVVIVGAVIFALDTVFGFGFNALIGRKNAAPNVDISDIMEMSTEDTTGIVDDATEDLTAQNTTDATENATEDSGAVTPGETESAAE